MSGINVYGLGGAAVGKVEVAKAPKPAADRPVEDSARDHEKQDGNHAVAKLTEAMNAAGGNLPASAKLVIRADKDSGRYIYEFRDPETNEVIQQYPDEVVLAALSATRQSKRGLTIDQTA